MVEHLLGQGLCYEPVAEDSGREPGVLHQRPAEQSLTQEKRELMPDLHPTPVAEDIDEPAARRSIRATLIIMGAAGFLYALVGVIIVLQVVHRPVGVHHGAPAWVVALFLGVVGIILVGSMLWVRRLYGRPIYRRVIQYTRRRRRLVMKNLLRGEQLSAQDMPVAAALLDLQRGQGRWLMVFFVVAPFLFIFYGLTNHGLSQWIFFGFAIFSVVYVPVYLGQRRKFIRNYERQSSFTVDGHRDDAATGTTG